MITLHHPKDRTSPHLQRTWDWVEANRAKFNIITEFTGDELSWCHLFQKYWGKDDILFIGHDVVPAEGMVEKLMECPYDICAQAALLNPLHTGLDAPVINHRKRDSTGSMSWIGENDEWADLFALELTKISLRAQKAFKVPDCGWKMTDTAMSLACPYKTHVHWPLVEHNQG